MEEFQIIKDIEDHSIVVINDIVFKGRRGINWEEVHEYVKRYIEKSYSILEYSDVIYIGTDFPEEIKGSLDTIRTKGGNAKAKANATTVMPYLIKYATNRR